MRNRGLTAARAQRNQASKSSMDLNAATKSMQKDATSLTEQTKKTASQASKELNKAAGEPAFQP